MVFKHPISAGDEPDMPLFLDIYGFDGIPPFPPETATFRNGTLTIFPKLFKKVPNYYVNSCRQRKCIRGKKLENNTSSSAKMPPETVTMSQI